jgi:transposase
MRDIDVFAKLLSLKRPWIVERVDLSPQEQRLDVWIRHRGRTRFHCPECGVTLPLYDHVPARTWRHLDHGSCLTWLHARVPRVACRHHGVRQVHLPWASPGARFSLAFERHAIDVLRETDVLGAARLLRVSWHEAWGLMERAVARGQKAKRARPIARLGVDEKAVAKGHQYLTLVCDLDRGTVEYIADDRKKSSLDSYYASRTIRQLAAIEAVAMDMWEPFYTSTSDWVPHAARKIVFDRYHIMTHMLKAVDDVRKAEHRRLLAEGDDTLKRTKYLWLYSEENLPERHADWFAQLRDLNLKTGRAWAIKESLRALWDYQRKGWAERHWQAWYFWATHSRLAPVIKVARMLKRNLANVLTYFDHFITNATCEGVNSKVQTIKKTPMAIAIRST